MNVHSVSLKGKRDQNEDPKHEGETLWIVAREKMLCYNITLPNEQPHTDDHHA